MRRSAKNGFTLIEAMVSIAILSIGLVLILQHFSQSLNILKSSENYLKASLLLENKIADLEIALKEGKDLLDQHEEIEDLGMIFKLDTELTPVECIIETLKEEIKYENLYRLSANLSWEERTREVKIPLSTYLIKHEKKEE